MGNFSALLAERNSGSARELLRVKKLDMSRKILFKNVVETKFNEDGLGEDNIFRKSGQFVERTVSCLIWTAEAWKLWQNVGIERIFRKEKQYMDRCKPRK